MNAWRSLKMRQKLHRNKNYAQRTGFTQFGNRSCVRPELMQFNKRNLQLKLNFNCKTVNRKLKNNREKMLGILLSARIAPMLLLYTNGFHVKSYVLLLAIQTNRFKLKI